MHENVLSFSMSQARGKEHCVSFQYQNLLLVQNVVKKIRELVLGLRKKAVPLKVRTSKNAKKKLAAAGLHRNSNPKPEGNIYFTKVVSECCTF